MVSYEYLNKDTISICPLYLTLLLLSTCPYVCVYVCVFSCVFVCVSMLISLYKDPNHLIQTINHSLLSGAFTGIRRGGVDGSGNFI